MVADGRLFAKNCKIFIYESEEFHRNHIESRHWNRFPFWNQHFAVDWLQILHLIFVGIRLGHFFFSVYKANTLISSIYIKANTLSVSLSFTMPWCCVPPSNNILYEYIFQFWTFERRRARLGPSLSSFTVFESCARGKHELRAAWCGKTSFFYLVQPSLPVLHLFFIYKKAIIHK